MEKRRRARINNSLNDLKTLVLESMKKDVCIVIYCCHFLEDSIQNKKKEKLLKIKPVNLLKLFCVK